MFKFRCSFQYWLDLCFSLIQSYVTPLLNYVHYYCKTLISVEYFTESNNLNLPGHFCCEIIELDKKHPVSFINVFNEIINIDKKVLLVIRERKRGINCVKSVHNRRFSGPYFPAFGLNTNQKISEYGHFSRSDS